VGIGLRIGTVRLVRIGLEIGLVRKVKMRLEIGRSGRKEGKKAKAGQKEQE